MRIQGEPMQGTKFKHNWALLLMGVIALHFFYAARAHTEDLLSDKSAIQKELSEFFKREGNLQPQIFLNMRVRLESLLRKEQVETLQANLAKREISKVDNEYISRYFEVYFNEIYFDDNQLRDSIQIIRVALKNGDAKDIPKEPATKKTPGELAATREKDVEAALSEYRKFIEDILPAERNLACDKTYKAIRGVIRPEQMREWLPMVSSAKISSDEMLAISRYGYYPVRGYSVLCATLKWGNLSNEQFKQINDNIKTMIASIRASSPKHKVVRDLLSKKYTSFEREGFRIYFRDDVQSSERARRMCACLEMLYGNGTIKWLRGRGISKDKAKPLGQGEKSHVYIPDDEKEYENIARTLGANAGAVIPEGFYEKETGAIYARTPSAMVMIHEATHQSLHNVNALSDLTGVWLDEGIAEYMSGSYAEEGMRPKRPNYIQWHMYNILRDKGKLLPIEILVSYGYEGSPLGEGTGQDWEEKAAAIYAQSWALVYYLIERSEGHLMGKIAQYIDLVDEEYRKIERENEKKYITATNEKELQEKLGEAQEEVRKQMKEARVRAFKSVFPEGMERLSGEIDKEMRRVEIDAKVYMAQAIGSLDAFKEDDAREILEKARQVAPEALRTKDAIDAIQRLQERTKAKSERQTKTKT